MAININLATLGTLNNTSILAQMNSNFATIQSALTNALALNGNTPNQMTSNLDMNANQIINLPPPGTPNSPARLVDVVNNPTLLLTVPPTGVSGATVPFCNSSSIIWSGTGITFQQPIALGQGGIASGVITLNGTTSGSAQISVNSTGALFIESQNSNVGFSPQPGQNASITLYNGVGGSVQLGMSPLGSQNGILQFLSSGSFAANGTVAQSLGSNGPAGSNAQPIIWLKILDNGGSPRFIPCF